MRALVIGTGAMGQRRIRDLSRLGVDVQSWDPLAERGSPRSVTGPLDVAVISTPPLTHRTFEVAAPIRFVEADVESDPHEHLPSATPRFTDWYEMFSGSLSHLISRTTAYTLHVGQHIADWHPGADLSTYYAAQRATGACREMVPFELCWLTGLFGLVDYATAIRGHTAGLAPIDDIYHVLVRHRSGVLGHMLIDALSRPARRSFTVVSAGDTRTFTLGYSEQVYAREMRALVDAVEGRAPWLYPPSEELANLRVLHMIERSG